MLYFKRHCPTVVLIIMGISALSSLAAGISRIPLSGGQMQIRGDGLRFAFRDIEGNTLAPAHDEAGALLNDSALSITEQIDETTFRLTSRKGEHARLKIIHESGHTAITITPEKTSSRKSPHQISFQFGGMPVAHGLGDVGGWNQTLNLVNKKETAYKLTHDGGKFRWLSSFAVFPKNNFATVVFDGLGSQVTLSENKFKTTIETTGPATIYCFAGDMKGIYSSYQALLRVKGYPIIKPKFRLFELGWESWAALGWRADSKTMLDSITRFQENGFPIRWAVSGSGFWERGGTTTSFGRFGEKFPDPMKFKEQLHRQDVKWMIGLRTNFVPPGGPHSPVTTKRNQNLVVDAFNGNSHSQTALDHGYFLKEPSGDLWKKPSGVFPIVSCYLLDGGNRMAAKWFGERYQEWNVDGIKEDTMMNLGQAHLDVFNQPIALLAEQDALVMARCGSFSSPGTLLRINDTSVDELVRRTPINYLQNAACGAPNAYSDTVGFKQMKSYSEKVIRQAWLMSLTAGMAVGESSSHWTKDQQSIFKKPFDFHYRFGPTLYNAAMKSYLTGYPYTMTPFGIAYPDDPQSAELPNFQWMLGDSLLCVPLLENKPSGKIDIYLPEGAWFEYDTGEKHIGPKLLQDFAMPVAKTPCFIGGQGILVSRSSEDAFLTAHIYPTGRAPEDYTFYHPDGASTSRISWTENSQEGQVMETTRNQPVAVSIDKLTGALSFNLLPNHKYLIK